MKVRIDVWRTARQVTSKTKMAFVKLCALVILACVGTGLALDCYVCRGCVTVGPEQVQTCPTRPTTAPPLTEPTTAPPLTEPTTAPPLAETTTAPPLTEPTTAPPLIDPTTAPPLTDPTTAPPLTEPTTDSVVNFAMETVKVASLPLLNELEEEGHKSLQYVLDDSELPGAGIGSRRLQQYRDDEDDTRCVIAVYQEANGTQNVVRDCAYAQADNATLCSDAVRDDFDGSILFCHVCQDDLCNAAPRTAVAALAMVVGVAMHVLY